MHHMNWGILFYLVWNELSFPSLIINHHHWKARRTNHLHSLPNSFIDIPIVRSCTIHEKVFLSILRSIFFRKSFLDQLIAKQTTSFKHILFNGFALFFLGTRRKVHTWSIETARFLFRYSTSLKLWNIKLKKNKIQTSLFIYRNLLVYYSCLTDSFLLLSFSPSDSISNTVLCTYSLRTTWLIND